MITNCVPYEARDQVKAISNPPGEYGGNAETQRNWRGPAQAEEHVV